MLVFVYGTLKRGKWNNRLLRTAKYITDATVEGYKLYDAGFPAAGPSEEDKVLGEIWEVKDGDQRTISNLDTLEGVPYMYTRETKKAVSTTGEEVEVEIYIGNSSCFSFSRMKDCPVNQNGHYEWDDIK